MSSNAPATLGKVFNEIFTDVLWSYSVGELLRTTSWLASYILWEMACVFLFGGHIDTAFGLCPGCWVLVLFNQSTLTPVAARTAIFAPPVQPQVIPLPSSGLEPSPITTPLAPISSQPLPQPNVLPHSIPARAAITRVVPPPTTPHGLVFESNAGQSDTRVQFQTRGLGGMVFFTPDLVALTLPSVVTRTAVLGQAPREAHLAPADQEPESRAHVYTAVHLTFEGANRALRLEGVDRLPGVTNYLRETTGRAAQTAITTYAGIQYTQLYPGIDVRYSGRDGRLKSTFIVAPGADPATIRWRYQGVRDLKIDPQGNLIIAVPVSPPVEWREVAPLVITEQAPIAWQERNGQHIPVDISFQITQNTQVSFVVGAYDRHLPLILDPTVDASSYLGGTSADIGYAITNDSQGNTYVTGYTDSITFPTTTGTIQPTCTLPCSALDVFVTKFAVDAQTQLYSTYLGGSGADSGRGIAVDSAGNATITSITSSSNFPTTSNAYDTSCGSNGACNATNDLFVASLNASGTALRYSSYFGGSQYDRGWAIAVDSTGNAYLAGETESTDFPAVHALSSGLSGLSVVVAKIDPTATGSASLIYSTYLGGNRSDGAFGIAVDSVGAAYVTGYTSSSNFPTTSGVAQPAIASVPNVLNDGFVSKLVWNGTTLSLGYSTYLGGSGSDYTRSIALDRDGNAYVTGQTGSSNFPTTAGAPDQTLGYVDAFITKINPTGSAWVYSTFLGGASPDIGYGIAVSDLGAALVTGVTESTDFSTTPDAFQLTKGMSADAFFTVVSPNGKQVQYSTYLGGESYDVSYAITRTPFGDIMLTGSTASTGFPTIPTQTAPSGWNTFLTRFSLARLQDDATRGPEDCNCHQPAPQLQTPHPVNTRTGNFWTAVTDMTVDHVGPPIEWQRLYASQAISDTSSLLSPGWQHPYATRLITPTMIGGEPNHVVIVSGSTNRLRYTSLGGGAYVSEAGIYSTLVQGTSVFTQTLRDQTQHIFDATTGSLTAIIDPLGRQVSLTYDTSSPPRLTDIVDTNDSTRFLTVTYDGSGRVDTVSDGTRTVQYSYDGLGDLISVLDLAGRTTSYLYQDHLLTGIDNALGQPVERIGYDTSLPTSKVITQTLQDGRQFAFHYLTATTVMTVTGVNSSQDVYQIDYDPSNAMTGLTVNGQAVLGSSFDDAFSPGAVVDGNNHQTTTRYTGQGLPTLQINALGQRTQATYNTANRLTSTTDALGVTTAYAYDPQGNVISTTMGITTTSALRLTSRYTYTYDVRYTGDVQLLETLSPDGVVTHYDYNTLGQRTTQHIGYGTALEQTTAWEYDSRGRMTATIAGVGTALERRDTTEYNADDTVYRTIQNYQDGAFDSYNPDQDLITTYGYDGLGRLIWVYDPLEHSSVTRYNATGQVEATARNVTPLTLDGDGQPIIPDYSAAAPDQNVAMRYAYDDLGKTTLVTETGLLTGTFNLATRIFSDTTTRMTRTEYDDQSRPITVTLNYRPDLPFDTLPDVNLQTITYYDGASNPIWRRDTLGRWTKTEYDALNRPIKVIANYQDGDPTTTPDDADSVTVTEYDALGRVVRTIANFIDGSFDPVEPDQDRITRTVYDHLGRVTSTIQNDHPASLLTRTDTNLTTTTAYDSVTGRVLGTQDTLGRWISQQYDDLGRVTTTIQACHDSGGTPQASNCDPFNPTTPDRNVPTTVAFDALGRVTATTNALNVETRTFFDGAGRSSAQVRNYADGVFDPLAPDTDSITWTTYDALGQGIRNIDAGGFASTSEYNGLGQTVAVIDPMDRVTRTGYDGTGASRWFLDQVDILTFMELDGMERVVATITNYEDGIVGGSEPNDRDLIQRTVYDGAGRRVESIDAAGQVTQFAYDNLDRLVAVTENAVTGTCPNDPCNVVTSYEYDRAGNRTAIEDANTNRRLFTYDAADRQVSAVDALSQETRWEYDKGGRVLFQRDPRGADFDLAYTYDGLDRPAQVSATALAAPIVTSYNAVGWRTGMQDATGITSFNHDALGRITSVAAPSTGTIGYGYDARGLRTQITYPDTSVIDYTYLPDGRLYQTQQMTTTLATYEYTPRGEPGNIFRANGVNSTFGFDTAGRLRYQHNTTLGGTVSEYVYTTNRHGVRTRVDENWQRRDSADSGTGTGLSGAYFSDTTLSTQVLTRTDSLIDFNWDVGSPDSSVPNDGFSVRWSGTLQPRYSEAYTFFTTASDGVRLWINGELLIDDWTSHGPTEQQGTTSIALTAGQQYTITLEYVEDVDTAEVHLDWQSRRQWREVIPTSQLYEPSVSAPQALQITHHNRAVDYTYDGLQRLTGVQEYWPWPEPWPVITYTYDLVGNRTGAWRDGTQIQNYTYDAANQVSGWTYDEIGNLIDDGVTVSAYDALNRLTLQGSTTNAYNGDGGLVAQTTGTSTISYTQDLAAPLSQILSDGANQYVYGNSAERLFGVAGSTHTWYMTDPLGSVRQTFDDAGVLQQALTYDAWGVLQGSSIAPFGYTGELQQGNQVYLRARWYNSANGAFSSRDAFAGMAEMPYSLMPYQYGYSNPVSNSDPTGHCPKPPASAGKRVICMALFIKPPEVSVNYTNIILHGDGRSFSKNSGPSQSRGYIWINVDTGQAYPHMNPTGYIFTSLGLTCSVPVGPEGTFGPPQLGVGQSRSAIYYFNPSTANQWNVNKTSNGSIEVNYDLVLAGPLEQIAPHINGKIVFYEDETGSYKAYGERDGFPWAEAYYHDASSIQTIFQRAAVRSDPEDLNALEGAYPYGWGWQLGYETRRRFLADPYPQKDVFGYKQHGEGQQ